MRICVIFNPTARGEGARRFRDALGALARQASLRPTTCVGDGRSLAAAAARESFDVVVASGGDGTVNEVLNGIADVSGALESVRFAVLPLGTVNVFARELRMPRNLSAAWHVILAGQETRIDLPYAEFDGPSGITRRYFAQMAGAGWDSIAIERTSWELKKKIGIFSYVHAGLKALASDLPKIVVSDGVNEQTGQLVLVGNGRFYGGNYPMFPLADLRDGLLEVTILPRVGLENLLRVVWGLGTKQLYTSGGAKHLKARAITMRSESRVPFHVEGENIGHLPARFAIEHHALRVIAPAL